MLPVSIKVLREGVEHSLMLPSGKKDKHVITQSDVGKESLLNLGRQVARQLR